MLKAIARSFCIAALTTTHLGLPAASQSIESAYTDLDLDKCRHTASSEPEDYGFWRCEGFGGVEVRVSAGDQRSYVSFGAEAEDEPAAAQTFPNFNSVDKTKVEWRMEKPARGKAVPFATIVRWNIKLDQDNKPSRGRVLVVTRLGDEVCHVGYVDALANNDPNSMARELADRHARTFDCDVDTPVIMGERGESIAGMVEQLRTEEEEKKATPPTPQKR